MDRKDYRTTFTAGGREYVAYDITKLEKNGIATISRLPFSIRILVENLLRHLDGRIVSEDDVKAIAGWKPAYDEPREIAHHPARVLMQDFTGVPGVVDLAAMRDAMVDLGGDASKINPLVPVDLVVDHSVQVDYYGTKDALDRNVEKEYERNGERYALLKWAQNAFDGVRIVPPNAGICHQVNLEYLARVVMELKEDGTTVAIPDSLVGTDSHTTMINGVGVMGWGVGGIEAEAVMLGQPYYMKIPQVIGFRLKGKLKEGVTATDLVLTVTKILREKKVVDKFVEFFGPGLSNMSVPDRATLANMSPEFGSTMAFFPVDGNTIDYLKLTNRGEYAELVETYAKLNGLWMEPEDEPEYTDIVELDLSTVGPCLAGPARPQDQVMMPDMIGRFSEILGCKYEPKTSIEDLSTFFAESPSSERGLGACDYREQRKKADIVLNGKEMTLEDGMVVIAAITSCTNTSNPAVMIGAGLVAKAAVEAGLKVPHWVKTSLAPGSKVVTSYLEKAGVMPYFEALGFHLAGFGCTTCIGNSGPIPAPIEQAVKEKGVLVGSVLSGNRNFEARIHPHVKANFLASPMLVVAFAIAGRLDVDLANEPLGIDPNGRDVYLKDIWPKTDDIKKLVGDTVLPAAYETEYATVLDGDEHWRNLSVPTGSTFNWDADSTYIRRPPFFEGMKKSPAAVTDIKNAKLLALLGDTITTDHISPAGSIPEDYPAGQYLKKHGVEKKDFNSYGSRRGNHEVMMRGTFANVRIKNSMVEGIEGGFTRKDGSQEYIYDAAMDYMQNGTPLVIFGGKEYGTGSSRDWAAKGTLLLGVKAVIAESFERIHRSNLVGMGVLPLQFKEGESWQSLGIDGTETITIEGLAEMKPRSTLTVTVEKNGDTKTFTVTSRLDTVVELDYYTHGGILPMVLRRLAE